MRISSRARIEASAWVLLLACTAGCASSPAGPKTGLSWEAVFESADGRVAFEIEAGEETVRVADGTGALLVTLRPTENGLEIENSRGRSVGIVVPRSDIRRGFRILAPGAASTLFELRRQPDGDLKLVDDNGETLYEIKKREYGFKVIDRNGEMESRIRFRLGKISVRDVGRATYLSTRDPIPVDAVAALTLEAVPFEYAAGLAVAIVRAAVPPE